MILLILLALAILFAVGFAITGALLAAFVWLVVKLPCAILVLLLGLLCCCTLLLLPLGLKLFGFGLRLLLPGI